MSGTFYPPPQGNPRRQSGDASGEQPTDPMSALPPAPAWPALPDPHPGELALPPGSPPGELLLPPGHPSALLPAPGAWTRPLPPPSGPLQAPPRTGAGSQAIPGVSGQVRPAAPPPTRGQSQPLAPSQPPAPRDRWFRNHRNLIRLLVTLALALLVVCALPLWAFGLWSAWFGSSHQPPPVLARLDPGGQRADAVGWSPDGRFLAEQITLAGAKSGDPNGAAVVLWDMSARREVRRLSGAQGGLAFAWSPDGAWLATTDGAHVFLWRTLEIDTPGGSVSPAARLNAPDPNEPVTGLAWAKDGLTLAVVDEQGLGIWKPSGGSGWKQQQYFRDSPCATVSCGRLLLWSPDGRWLLAAPWHGSNGISGVGVWDTQTWKQAPLLAASAPLAWSPDSALVLVRASNETTLSAVRAGSWTAAWTINPNPDLRQGYNVYPQAAGWSSDGRWLVGSADGWVDLWPTDTRKSAWVWNEQQRDQSIYSATSLAWSPGADTLAVTTDGTALLTLYDLRNPSPPLSAPPLL